MTGSGPVADWQTLGPVRQKRTLTRSSRPRERSDYAQNLIWMLGIAIWIWRSIFVFQNPRVGEAEHTTSFFAPRVIAT